MFVFKPKYAVAFAVLFVCVAGGVFSVIVEKKDAPVWSEESRTVDVVILDAGHGGADGGTVGRAGTVEKDLNLEIALLTREFCDILGVETVLTREEDVSLGSGDTLRRQKINDLKKRVDIANRTEQGVLISIHQNYFDDYVSRGAQVFYAPGNPYGKTMALRMQSLLKEFCGGENKRTAMAIPNGNYMLENLACPAIIIECGFLSHLEEEMLLNSPEYRAKIAFAVAAGAMECVAGGIEPDLQ